LKLARKVSAILFGAALITGLAACSGSDGTTPTDQTSAAASSEAANAGAGLNLIFTNEPAPVFATSAYRQQLIEIEAVEALGSPTTAMFFPPGWNGNSHPFKTCPAEGLPIPNTTQLDNPSEIVQDPYGGGYQLNQGGIVKPQADPNGVYTPTSSSGTYVSCLSTTGGLQAAYWEGDMYAQTGDAIWNTTLAMVQDVGPDQLPVCTAMVAHAHDGSGIKPGTSYTHCVKAPCPAGHHTIACDPSTTAYIPSGTPSGKVTLTARDVSSTPITLNCSMHEGTIWQNGRKQTHQGLVSTCGYPGGLSLTFAPWGIVSAH
jgi:hypothetical protein